MVWIQGGMFEISSTAAYDGTHFARDGVVRVVINWRPGAEGSSISVTASPTSASSIPGNGSGTCGKPFADPPPVLYFI